MSFPGLTFSTLAVTTYPQCILLQVPYRKLSTTGSLDSAALSCREMRSVRNHLLLGLVLIALQLLGCTEVRTFFAAFAYLLVFAVYAIENG